MVSHRRPIAQPRVELEFGPCRCAAYSQARESEDYGKLDGEPAEHYDTEMSAARGFLAALKTGSEVAVHWQERHVAAVWVDGVRHPAQEVGG